MKKSLQELQARSGSVAIQPRAAKIALDAKSPTDAFNLALASTYYDKNEAEEIRYLAMIKRDYGIETLRSFLEEVNSFALASSFLDRVTVAMTYIDFCQAIPTMATSEPKMMVKVARLIDEVAELFRDNFRDVLSRQTETSDLCKKRLGSHGDSLMHIKVMFEAQAPIKDDPLFFGKAGLVLFSLGRAVAEQYGLYFMRAMPMSIIGCF